MPSRAVAGGRDTILPVDACGTCTACSRIARGIHPDVIALAPDPDAGNIKVDVVRELIDSIGYRPFEGRWRVVIIDDADTLLEAAQNALLKTLEEPPSSSVFVLVTAHPDGLLATVRSRCPQVRFAPLSAAEVAAHLQAAHGMHGARWRTPRPPCRTAASAWRSSRAPRR